MTTPSNNIFEIEKPGDYRCVVESFAGDHKILSISVTNVFNGEQIHLHFGRVAYFSGAVTWKGADFRLASADEQQKFAEETHKGFAESSKHLLFMVQGDNNLHIRIFALFVTKEDGQGKHPSITLDNFTTRTST